MLRQFFIFLFFLSIIGSGSECLAVARISATCDVEGRRVGREYRVNGVLQTKSLWVYDGFLPLYEKETNAAGGDLAERFYVWSPIARQTGGASGLLWYREKVGTTTKVRSPLYDGRGNLVGLVDGDTGQQVSRYYYGPFGEPIGRRGEPSPLGFVTHYTDPVTGLVDFGQRWYNATTGHWLSREPLGEGESVNLYAYCNNDPVNYIDYLGLERLDARCPSRSQIQAMVDYYEIREKALPYEWAMSKSDFDSWDLKDRNRFERDRLNAEIDFYKKILRVHEMVGPDGYGYESGKYRDALNKVYGMGYQETGARLYHDFFMPSLPGMSDQKRAYWTADSKLDADFAEFIYGGMEVSIGLATAIPMGGASLYARAGGGGGGGGSVLRVIGSPMNLEKAAMRARVLSNIAETRFATQSICRGLATMETRAAEQIAAAENAASELMLRTRSAHFSTPRDGAVFWTGYRRGNQAHAMAWAEANGKFTIEMTPGGQWLNSLNLYGPNSPVTRAQADALWRVASERFAGSASGRVNVFKRGTFHNPDAVFYNIELPALRTNTQVNPKITYRGY